MVIHRSSIGCIERTIAYLLEKTQGRLPLWLSPIQVKVVDFTDRNLKSCEKFVEKLENENIRVETDFRQIPIQGKIKEAEMQKVPYIVVIGDKEETTNSVAVRSGKKIESLKAEEFIKKIKKEILERK
jgi:threonyl-tRNA synthetase